LLQLVLKTSEVSIVTVPVELKTLSHERRDLLVLFRASFFRAVVVLSHVHTWCIVHVIYSTIPNQM